VGLVAIAAIGLFLKPAADRETTYHARAIADQIVGPDGLAYSTVTTTGPAQCTGAAVGALTHKKDAPPIAVSCEVVAGDHITVSVGAAPAVTRDLPNGWALLPPLLAILLAFVFRKVIGALAIAVVAAALLAADFAPGASISNVWTIMAPALTSPFNLSIYAFTIFLIGMIGIQLRNGGLDGFIDLLARRATGRRSAQAVTAAMGGAVFFDDYANSIVVGASARPLTDRFKISREKLAYLVDSMAAPVAGIAIVSTWIGFEVGLFNDQADLLQEVGTGGYGIFFAVLPYRFYCILSIVMVALIAVTGRDFGPMRKAEQRAARGDGLIAPGATPMASDALTSLGPAEGVQRRWINGVLPVVLVLTGVVVGYAVAGARLTTVEVSLTSLDWWQVAFSAAGDSMGGNLGAYILLLASIAGSLTAATMTVSQKLLSPRETFGAWWQAVSAVAPTLVILALAIAIRKATEIVHADWFLVTLLGDINLIALPMAIFLLAAVTAFSTGTSWGTMGILMPVVVPLVYAQVKAHGGDPLVLALCLSAVLDGAIFGDHCSPISDTTVMSSMASACDHIDHVRTQMPYATAVMLAAGIGGYTLTAWAGTSPWTAYAVGGFALALVVLVFGKPMPAELRGAT